MAASSATLGLAPQAPGKMVWRDWINAAARPAVSSALGMCSIMACLSALVLRRPPPRTDQGQGMTNMRKSFVQGSAWAPIGGPYQRAAPPTPPW